MRAGVLVVGGGIVGLAVAYRLSGAHRLFGERGWGPICLLEKEEGLARHQTGRNSGVIHSGIYYRPGSLKASTCREGRRRLIEFCEREQVPFELCGKVVVAVDDAERPGLERLFERGQANGVDCELVGPERLRELEPHAAGVAAIHVRDTGIIDYSAVCDRLSRRLREGGHSIHLGARVTRILESNESVVVETTRGPFEADRMINCAGLYSDRLAQMAGVRPKAKIVPFRGEYFALGPSAQSLCRNLIYPLPDPRFPFLGVHFTRMIGGGVECGPNAVFALAREGYRKTDVSPGDVMDAVRYPGFPRLARRHLRTGLGEIYRSFSKRAFTRTLQRLVPEIRPGDLTPIDAGVRAQAVLPDGTLLDDFSFEETARTLHVINAVSPAATASLAIADLVVARLGLHLA